VRAAKGWGVNDRGGADKAGWARARRRGAVV
jgi:hypothetical protein